ncbi:MAG TPA: PAS domain S-box protein [Chthoniobacterales bacterium]
MPRQTHGANPPIGGETSTRGPARPTEGEEGTLPPKIFRLLIEATPSAVVLANREGRVVLANPEAEKLFGYAREELVGQTVDMLVPERFRAVHPSYRTAYSTRPEARPMGKGRDLFARRKDGSEVPVEIGLNPIETPEGSFILSVIIDISERKAADERQKATLRELNDLRTALDEHAIVAMTDAQGTIVYVNDKFCEISKYGREELLGQDHRLINSGHHPKEFMRDLWQTIGRGEVWKGEIKNRAKDDSYYWVDTTIVPFLKDDGKPHHYVAVRADITERKRVEEQVLELNAELERRVAERTAELEAANRELEAFSYSVSHDLRAPLRAVDGFSQAVLDDFGALLPEEGRHYLQTIRAGAQRMGQLIDDLLTFARLSRLPLTRQPIDTDSVVRQALAELAPHSDGRSVDLRIGDLAPCEGDPGLIRQVWVNLLSNALKYTRQREAAVIDIGSRAEDGETVYYVTDNGTGFDMRYSDKLFGVFQRLHRAEEFEGTGVGLAIAQRVIHRHRGRIWAEAELGQGATFQFTLGTEENQ